MINLQNIWEFRVQDSITISHSFDAIIIGGGPAGSSCALWLKMLGYHPCIIEKRASLGGLQNDSPYPNPWIPGVSGLTGQEFAQAMHEQIVSHDIPLYLDAIVRDIESVKDGYLIHIENIQGLASALFSPHLVLACGVKPASGGLTPSQDLLIGPGDQVENYSFTGKKVAILGGGDNAFENYQFIQQKQPELIHIYARQDNTHGIKARYEFLKYVPDKDVFCFQGNLNIDSDDLTINGIAYDTIIALYGWVPNFPPLSFELELTGHGYVKTDIHTAETSQANVYAIGEFACRAHPCCVTAMADGVTAAKAIQNKFEQSRRQIFFSSKKQ